MTVYHGTPFGGDRQGVTTFLRGRHALIPFLRQEDLATALEVCTGVIVDNSAFTAWKTGQPIDDWSEYYELIKSLYRHPRFDWAIVPDVIDGTEADNDELWGEWPLGLGNCGVVVWHLHESLERLERVVHSARNSSGRICLGSSGEYATPGNQQWHDRMAEAMSVICDEHGRPQVKIHGLRMAAADIVSRYPFASTDSTNVAQNASLLSRFGMYPAPSRWQRAANIAARMEFTTSPAVYTKPTADQGMLEFELTTESAK